MLQKSTPVGANAVFTAANDGELSDRIELDVLQPESESVTRTSTARGATLKDAFELSVMGSAYEITMLPILRSPMRVGVEVARHRPGVRG